MHLHELSDRMPCEETLEQNTRNVPIAKPRRYIDNPTVPSSVDELNAVTMSGAADE